MISEVGAVSVRIDLDTQLVSEGVGEMVVVGHLVSEVV